ncbi:MAG TPA: endonuclease/exonuclease/phosphatase family protein [Candidatus Paceibacterota bacterium]|nr:endonuclease/exonuclease/phosphatase family protein [Candidatus Paceibacterota bacterium]HRZ34400.1 endonuclease/exonuclease/phosphatase family protein [Candidatus Paceibacterota bacterium]
MKIITLNTWGGKIKEPLFDFLKQNKDIEVFCFQEIFKGGLTEEMENLTNISDANPSLYEDIVKILPNHVGIFCPVYKESYGTAIFVKKDIQILEQGDVFLYENKTFPNSDEPDADNSRKMQRVKLNTTNGILNIFNLHGHWVRGSKEDTSNRLEQSNIILDQISKSVGPIILCGDFNLKPDTQSIKMIEDKMVNLIRKYNIKTTRTKLYTKSEKFADYIFVSSDIKEKIFKVLPYVVSDHTALLLEI